MKLVNEPRDIGRESIIAVLTGDGRTETRILEYFAERHNGNGKVLLLPSLPIKSKRGRGVSALRVVKEYLNYRIRNTLFLVDREYFDDNITEKTVGTLRNYGIDPLDTDLFETNRECALRIRGSVGGHEILIYMAILGHTKCIEENIAKLIELELGIEVKPNKTAIHKTLREHGIDKYKIVKNARDGNLKEAFPALYLILEIIKKNNA